MITTEIINRRKANLRINYCIHYFEDLNDLLQFQGLSPKKEGLRQIEYSQAFEIVTTLLNRDLAFGVEIIPIKEAIDYTKLLFEDLDEEKCICYTNGEWNNYHKSNGFGFNEMTKSTFDAGVLITSNYLTFCFWIEEQD